MEKKHIIVVFFGGIALTALTAFLVKRYMTTTVEQPAADQAAASGAPTVSSSVIPAYTPTGNAYQPLPVGAVTSNSGPIQAPPGVSDSSVALPTQPPVKSLTDAGADLHQAVSDLSYTPPQVATPDPTTAGVSGLTGNSAILDARYEALFGRHAEQGGLDYWNQQLASGNVTLANLDQELTRQAQAPDRAAEVTLNPNAVIQYLKPSTT